METQTKETNMQNVGRMGREKKILFAKFFINF